MNKIELTMTNKKQHITKSTIGAEGEPIAIIDNFFPSPETLANAAKDRVFTLDSSYYPGHRTAAPNQYIQFLYETLVNNLGDLFGFDKSSFSSIESRFSLVDKKPEDLQVLQKVPHFDVPKKNGLACIHYLCPAQSNYGGTSFYRHKSTGYEFVDAGRVEHYMKSLEMDIEKYGLPDPPEYINGDTDIFTRVASYEAVYNRALFYRASSLHSGNIKKDHNFNLDPELGRLTMTSFTLLK